MLQFTVAGVNTNLESVTFSEIGFGRHLEKMGKPYILTLEIEDFIYRFRSIYDDCILELIRDDQITTEFYPPYPGAKSYPSLEEFLSLREALRMEMIETYFKFDIFRLYIKEDANSAKVQWLINSPDSFCLHGSNLLVGGHVANA